MFNDFNYYQAYYCYGLVVYIAFHSLINCPVLGVPTTKHHVGNKIKEFDKMWTSPTRLKRGTLHLRSSQTIHIGVDRWSISNQSSSSALQPELSSDVYSLVVLANLAVYSSSSSGAAGLFCGRDSLGPMLCRCFLM